MPRLWKRANGAVVCMRAGLSSDNVMIAFDGMRVPLAQLPHLPRLLPAVCAALEHVENGDVQGQDAP